MQASGPPQAARPRHHTLPYKMSLLSSKSGEMRYNNLGNSGLLVSELSLGCMTLLTAMARRYSERGSFGKAHGGVNGERAVETSMVSTTLTMPRIMAAGA